MREKVVTKLMGTIERKEKLSKTKYEQIEYGLSAIYILVTKLVFISIVAYLLGIFKGMFIFLLLFNVIRTFAFGLHATKSYICLIVSTLTFIGIPYLAPIIHIDNTIKLIVGIALIIAINLWSPADTYKRPIVSKKRRLFFKITSTVIATVFVILSFYTNNFISNCLIFSLLLETILISPITYRIFNLPYNNYIKYLERMEQNVS